MIRILGFSGAVIFIILSLFHFYRAMGGRFGSDITIPSIGDERTFNPSSTKTIMVAAACLIAAMVIPGRLGSFGTVMPKWVFRLGSAGIGVLFFLRAIGDFKLVGFFKQINNTPFAYWDTRLFSPLCLFIAAIAFLIGYSKI